MTSSNITTLFTPNNIKVISALLTTLIGTSVHKHYSYIKFSKKEHEKLDTIIEQDEIRNEQLAIICDLLKNK